MQITSLTLFSERLFVSDRLLADHQNGSAVNRLLSPQHANLVLKLDKPFIQPIYYLKTTTMSYGRIANIGDAAFTARPHLGVGITKASEDSLALAVSLEMYSDVPVALQHCSSARHSVNTQWVNKSRELGAYLQAQLLSDAERRHAQIHQTTEAVMRETANLQC